MYLNWFVDNVVENRTLFHENQNSIILNILPAVCSWQKALSCELTKSSVLCTFSRSQIQTMFHRFELIKNWWGKEPRTRMKTRTRQRTNEKKSRPSEKKEKNERRKKKHWTPRNNNKSKLTKIRKIRRKYIGLIFFMEMKWRSYGANKRACERTSEWTSVRTASTSRSTENRTEWIGAGTRQRDKNEKKKWGKEKKIITMGHDANRKTCWKLYGW